MLWAPMMVVCAECVLGERKMVTKTDFSVVLLGPWSTTMQSFMFVRQNFTYLPDYSLLFSHITGATVLLPSAVRPLLLFRGDHHHHPEPHLWCHH